MGRVMPVTSLVGPAAIAASSLILANSPSTSSSSSSSSSSLVSWLSSELDRRGIDAVVYTRYILSILQQDSNDVIADFFPPSAQEERVEFGNGRQARGWLAATSRGEGGRGKATVQNNNNLHSLRKSAAIKVLSNSIDWEDPGLDTLVNECYKKLHEDAVTQIAKDVMIKEVKSAEETVADGTNSQERYFAAFPALSEKCDELRPRAPISTTQWASVAKQITNKPSSSSSIISNSPSKQEKDSQNMESKGRGGIHSSSASSTPPWVDTVTKEQTKKPRTTPTGQSPKAATSYHSSITIELQPPMLPEVSQQQSETLTKLQKLHNLIFPKVAAMKFPRTFTEHRTSNYPEEKKNVKENNNRDAEEKGTNKHNKTHNYFEKSKLAEMKMDEEEQPLDWMLYLSTSKCNEQSLLDELVFTTDIKDIEGQLDALPVSKTRLYQRTSTLEDSIDIVFADYYTDYSCDKPSDKPSARLYERKSCKNNVEEWSDAEVDTGTGKEGGEEREKPGSSQEMGIAVTGETREVKAAEECLATTCVEELLDEGSESFDDRQESNDQKDVAIPNLPLFFKNETDAVGTDENLYMFGIAKESAVKEENLELTGNTDEDEGIVVKDYYDELIEEEKRLYGAYGVEKTEAKSTACGNGVSGKDYYDVLIEEEKRLYGAYGVEKTEANSTACGNGVEKVIQHLWQENNASLLSKAPQEANVEATEWLRGKTEEKTAAEVIPFGDFARNIIEEKADYGDLHAWEVGDNLPHFSSDPWKEGTNTTNAWPYMHLDTAHTSDKRPSADESSDLCNNFINFLPTADEVHEQEPEGAEQKYFSVEDVAVQQFVPPCTSSPAITTQTSDSVWYMSASERENTTGDGFRGYMHQNKACSDEIEDSTRQYPTYTQNNDSASLWVMSAGNNHEVFMAANSAANDRQNTPVTENPQTHQASTQEERKPTFGIEERKPTFGIGEYWEFDKNNDEFVNQQSEKMQQNEENEWSKRGGAGALEPLSIAVTDDHEQKGSKNYESSNDTPIYITQEVQAIFAHCDNAWPWPETNYSNWWNISKQEGAVGVTEQIQGGAVGVTEQIQGGWSNIPHPHAVSSQPQEHKSPALEMLSTQLGDLFRNGSAKTLSGKAQEDEYEKWVDVSPCVNSPQSSESLSSGVDSSSRESVLWNEFSLHPPKPSEDTQRSTSAGLKLTTCNSIMHHQHSAFSEVEFVVRKKELVHAKSDPLLTGEHLLQLLPQAKFGHTAILRHQDEVHEQAELSKDNRFSPIIGPPLTPGNSPVGSSSSLYSTTTQTPQNSPLHASASANDLVRDIVQALNAQLEKAALEQVAGEPDYPDPSQCTDKSVQTSDEHTIEHVEEEMNVEQLIKDMNLLVEEDDDEEETDEESLPEDGAPKEECSSGDEPTECKNLASLWTEKSHDSDQSSDSDSADKVFSKNIWAEGASQIPYLSSKLAAALEEAFPAPTTSGETCRMYANEYPWNTITSEAVNISSNASTLPSSVPFPHQSKQPVITSSPEFTYAPPPTSPTFQATAAGLTRKMPTDTDIDTNYWPLSSSEYFEDIFHFDAATANKEAISTPTHYQGGREMRPIEKRLLRKSWKELDEEVFLQGFDESDSMDEHQLTWLHGDDMFQMDDMEMLQAGGTGAPEQPTGRNVMYSDQLEHSWMESNTNFTVQRPQKHHKTKLGPSKKLCTYFKEGNCHRADCKFAHDMALITCRFWEKAECFKGPTCPFLHGYVVEEEPVWKGSEQPVEKVPEFRREDFPELTKSTQDAEHKSPGTAEGRRSSRSAEKKRSKKSSSPRRTSQPIDIKRNWPK